MTTFLLAKGELISDIAAGINIRMFNQAIAPKGNPAIGGLKKYAAAQKTENKIAHKLTGDPKDDEKPLHMLQSDIMGGIKLNMMNLKKVSLVGVCFGGVG